MEAKPGIEVEVEEIEQWVLLAQGAALGKPREKSLPDSSGAIQSWLEWQPQAYGSGP